MEGDASLDRLAISATAHCLAGCAIGEVPGLAIGTYRGGSPPGGHATKASSER